MSFHEYYSNAIKEKKLSIQRFSGSNEMSDADLLTFLHQLQSVATNGNIDLTTNDHVSMTEKFDGSPANWGMSPEFFMESANSGEVTSSNIEKFNNPYTIHFYKAFKFLVEYKPFLERLQKAQSYAGAPVKYISEMFPVLTHKGDNCGDFIFCSTKYNKSKLGNSGAFMVFDVKVQEGDSWVEPSDDIKDMLLDIVRSTDDPEWKVYYVNRDGKLSGTLQFEFSGVNDWISSPEKLASSISLLRKKSPESKALKDLIAKIRPGLQKQLDNYAETTSSSLGSGKSPIEGVVLKVDTSDGPTFIKGTSQLFSDIAKGTWGTRKELGAIEKTLTGQFLKDVVGLRTDQPAALNRAIAEVGKEFQSDKEGDEKLNEFTFKLLQKLRVDGYMNDEQAARKKAASYIEAAKKQLAQVTQNWQQTKATVDPDSVAKTENMFKYTQEMLDKYQERIVNKEYNGDAYMVYLLRLILGRRIDSFVTGGTQEIDELAGGRAEGMTLEQIAAKHGVSLDDLKKEYAIGIQEELEHTNDHEIASQIAMDHLVENPHYYTILKGAGLEEEGEELDELDVSNVLAKVKQLMARKPSAPVKKDTDDDLSDGGYDHDVDLAGSGLQAADGPTKAADHAAQVFATRLGKDDLDDTNIPDQDPSFRPGIDPRPQLMGHDETPEELAAKKKQKRADALHDYLHGFNDIDQFAAEYVEDAEEFEEDEILDERKFEKVKMARNMLSKLGYPKAYDRNEKGKYILRSKHIRKLMRKLGYTFNDEKGRWIMKNAPPEEKPEDQTPDVIDPVNAATSEPTQQVQGKKAVIWVGRAQPWHKGHDTLIQQGLSKLGDPQIGANMVFILLVKGAGTGEDKTKNPMDFQQQADLIGEVYAAEDKVDVSSIPVATGSIVDILATASKQNIIVKGWLAGSDRIAGYKKQFDAFKTDKYKGEFEQKTAPGTPYPLDGDIVFVDVGREEEAPGPKLNTKAGREAAAADKAAKQDALAAKAAASKTPVIPVEQMSGSLARGLVSKLDAAQWTKEVCPTKYLKQPNVQEAYQQVYNILKTPVDPVKETYLESSLKDKLTNIFFGG